MSSAVARPIAPATFYAHQALRRDPQKRCKRAKRDEALCPKIREMWSSNNDGTYGANKVWRELRKKVPVARCTVERR